MWLRDFRFCLTDPITSGCLKLIELLNPEKDNGLASKLQSLAELYWS